MSRQPQRDLKRRQRRRRKLHHLREQLNQVTNSQERRRLIAKIRKISPAAPTPER